MKNWFITVVVTLALLQIIKLKYIYSNMLSHVSYFIKILFVHKSL